MRRGALAYLVQPFEPKAHTAKPRAYARCRRRLLSSAASLDQGEIDPAQRALLADEESASSSSGAATEQAVLGAVAAAGGEVTVVEVAEAVGIARATAQRYLAQLAQAGHLRLKLRYGSRGRPEHRYSSR